LREEFAVSINYDAHAKQNLYSFDLKQPSSSVQPLIRPADSEDVAEFAGVAGVDPANP
jgi:hypothetical protein